MDEGCGAISLSMGELATKALIVPSTSDFTVSITPTDKESEQEEFSSLYTQLPIAVVLIEGEYKVEAVAGGDEPFTVDEVTYKAENIETVEINRITNVSLTATMYSYAVEVCYGSDFLDAFSEFWIEVHVGDGRYAFASGEDEIGYVTPGTSSYVLKGTTADGQSYSSVIAQITSEGKEHYRLNLSIRPLGHLFEIDVDAELVTEDVSGDVDPSLYPDMNAPAFGEMIFTETQEYSEENATNSNISLRALTTLYDVELQFTDSYFTSYGIDNEKIYSFASDDDIAELNSLGVVLSEGGVGENAAVINIGALVAKMELAEGDSGEYGFIVTVKDRLQDESGDYLEAQSSAVITLCAPQFTMPEVGLGNIWTKEFTVEEISKSDITAGSYDVMTSRGGFSYEYSADGENWNEMTSLTVSDLTQSASGTKYYVRATYRHYTSTVVELTTEATTQIPNNSFATNYSTTSNGQPCYWFFASGASSADQWWATRNEKTTSEGIDAKYTRYSGSRPTSGSGIQLVTCGWGAGNTAAGSWSVIYNVWAGAVFLGSFTYDEDSYSASDCENHGKEFSSRPTAMTFDYTYSPYNSSDNYIAKIWLENRSGSTTTQLAYGESTSSSSQSSFKTQTITLSYSNTSLPITHLCVAFYSGKNEGSSSYVENPSFASSNPSLGSDFYVNNVTLIYGK